MSERPATQPPIQPPITASPWQPASLDTTGPATPAPDEGACDLDAAHAAAQAAGFAEGRAAGYEQGLVAGRATGEQTGYTEGHQKGQQEGYQEGHRAGLAEGRAIAREHAERLAALTDELAQGLRALEADMGQALLTLALAVAQKIVGDTLAQHPETILACIREALRIDANADAAPLRLWLHPDDLDIVNAHMPDALRGSACRLVGEARVSRGGCRVETAFGEIDATLETRWQQAVTALVGSAGSAPP